MGSPKAASLEFVRGLRWFFSSSSGRARRRVVSDRRSICLLAPHAVDPDCSARGNVRVHAAPRLERVELRLLRNHHVVGLTADTAGARDRTRLAVTGLLLTLAGVAWVTTAVRMEGMESAPGMYPENLAFYASAWVVMMAAMMFPSVWPTVDLYALMQRGRREQGLAAPAGATVTFVG